ncbi:MAG: tRNA (cytidine(34)-2'-O)-methyltransferase [Oscillospiraceae bacterium]|nr:tRNA (cytidine(34)-2'-O)-methyltransferase [Oscillospiraceae bacterium]
MNNKLNIVLLEPQIPQNTGNISRTCAATGAKLHMIRPFGFTIDDKKLKRAGLDYWDLLDLEYYDDINDFYSKNEGEFYYFTTKGQNRYCDIEYSGNVYLIFGREDAGIPEEILVKNPSRCVRVPMIEGARSLNLSNTVALAAYETLRQWNFDGLLTVGQLTKYKW